MFLYGDYLFLFILVVLFELLVLVLCDCGFVDIGWLVLGILLFFMVIIDLVSEWLSFDVIKFNFNKYVMEVMENVGFWVMRRFI